MRYAIAVTLALSSLACAGKTPAPAAPKLRGEATHIDFKPQTIFIQPGQKIIRTAWLRGGNPRWLCPAMEWDFGDGGHKAPAGEAPNTCSQDIAQDYFETEWRYTIPGQYRQTLTIWWGGRKVATGFGTVVVMGENQ